MQEQRPQAGHNSVVLSDEMKGVFEDIYDLQEEIREFKGPRQEKITELRRKFKTATGIEAKDVQNLYRLFAREKELEQFTDDAERRRVAGNIRKLYQAARKGQTLNFLDALDADFDEIPDGPEPAVPEGESDPTPPPSDAYKIGKAAGLSGKGSRLSNPYEHGTEARANWDKGWDEGQLENVGKIQKGNIPPKAKGKGKGRAKANGKGRNTAVFQ